MASASGKKTSSSRKKSTTGRKADPEQMEKDSALFHEIGLIVLFAVTLILFFCNFGIIGSVGDSISGVLFGLFGFTAYIASILLFLAFAFWFANRGNPTAVRKLAAGVALFLMAGVVCDLVAGMSGDMDRYDAGAIYLFCSDGRKGGGVLAGSVAYLLQHYLGTIGTILLVLLCSVISLILLTERSFLSGVRSGGSRIRELSREDAKRRREQAAVRRKEQDRQRARREEERRIRAEEKENDRILRMEKKVTGVMVDTSLKKETDRRGENIHEITCPDEREGEGEDAFSEESGADSGAVFDFEKIRIRSTHQVTLDPSVYEAAEAVDAPGDEELETVETEAVGHFLEPSGAEDPFLAAESKPVQAPDRERQTAAAEPRPKPVASRPAVHSDTAGAPLEKSAVPREYRKPSLNLLQKGKAAVGDSERELKETAKRLQQTLATFGVKVAITDISQGPSVTRYEMQPEQGVKVSKIVGLTEDIKLNLAATDIRMEAPIPGKAAIGIEVPNRETMPVSLRELLETSEFQNFKSNLAFAVGKDIAGKVVVTDIAKMPHMLIAGSTGSGKSVCINTLIMSILYKAHPDEVKLIMVDPKVVELSVYNGIPHLLIPVVTDPKKASAALHWAVTEMDDRYRRLAELNVREIHGYNEKVKMMRDRGDENAPATMPQIVIIVDELADLMMVAAGEVEESICRLAQLARAAGIHLIIATQRPSVDVITGLIKANMPSRVAFAVSSGVDSRTILDMNGAEKLLGKGDMLFYPQGYSKPARVQGAFVSDREVSDVVDFLKNQAIGNTYAEEIEAKISQGGSAGGAAGGDSEARDEYFEQAGRFIIDKDKASIGMLQRVLKVGFNRAARIMDQLCEYGVVGEEEGTKPRKVLMSMEQFEQLLEDI